MKNFSPKTKTAAAVVTSLVALTGAALAHGANTREVSVLDPKLEAQVVRLGELPNFWEANCPMALGNATAWAQGDNAEAAVLHSEGFVDGVREPLYSESGDTGVSVALRFRSAAGANADLERRERLAGHQGYAMNFAVLESPSVRAYTVRTADSTTVQVSFTRGPDEYELSVEAAQGTNIDALQRMLATAVTRVAGGR